MTGLFLSQVGFYPMAKLFAGSRGNAMTPKNLDNLTRILPGKVFARGDQQYDVGRKTWNGTIDQYPAAIVRPQTRDDIVKATQFAAERNIGVSIRATGHGALMAAGKDAILIDTSQMKGLTIDPSRRTATLEPGVTAIGFLTAAQKHGLGGPTAVSPGVGMTGYTLSGGYGDLPRVFGLGSDNLLSADVVLANGTTLRVSEKENSDLFWAMRGGGGNFAIVASMTLRLHPIDTVLAGVLTYGVSDAQRAIRGLREWVKDIPDIMAMSLSLLPASITGGPEPIVVISLVYVGNPDEGAPLVDKLVKATSPKSVAVKPQSYMDYFSGIQDPGSGFFNYWYGVLFDELTDPAIDALIDSISRPESLTMLLFSYYRGGVWSRLPEDYSAVSHRQSSWLLNGRAFFSDPALIGAAKLQVASLATRLAPFNKRKVPFTYLEYEGPSRLPDVYSGGKLERLRSIKRKYDPENLLRFNANIAPR